MPAPARHDAIARGYLYQVSRRKTAFGKPFVWWVRDPVRVDVVTRAAARFEGFRNFASFTQDDPDEKSTDVAVSRVSVEERGSAMALAATE